MADMIRVQLSTAHCHFYQKRRTIPSLVYNRNVSYQQPKCPCPLTGPNGPSSQNTSHSFVAAALNFPLPTLTPAPIPLAPAVARQSTSMPPTSSPPLQTQPDEFDIFADVSHHGSTLFEFLSLPSHLETPAFPTNNAPPASALSDTTLAPSDPSRSVSTLSPRPASFQPADSECTVEAGESKLKPIATAKNPLPERAGDVKREPPPPISGKRAALPPTKSIGKPRTAPVARGGSKGKGKANGSEGSEQSNEGEKGKVEYSGADEGGSKDTHNSHTRRCRAKVNSKFQELLSILPRPPPKTGIKHKAQILDYTIRVFRDIHAKKTLLEAELALSSRAQLNQWLTNVIARSVTLQDALGPYLSLICTKGRWKYSEAWVPELDRGGGRTGESEVLTPSTIGCANRLRLGLAVIPSLGNTDDPDLQVKLEKFRDRSRNYGCRPRVDLPGRIMCTMRPEWLPSLEDQEAFQRAPLAGQATLVVCFGVPIFVKGRVAAVAVFFDTEQRGYDAKIVDLADNLAGMLGNAYGASAVIRKKTA